MDDFVSNNSGGGVLDGLAAETMAAMEKGPIQPQGAEGNSAGDAEMAGGGGVDRFVIDPATGQPELNSRGKPKKVRGRKPGASVSPSSHVASDVPPPSPLPPEMTGDVPPPRDEAAIKAGAENAAESIVGQWHLATASSEKWAFKVNGDADEKRYMKGAIASYFASRGWGETPLLGVLIAVGCYFLSRVPLSEFLKSRMKRKTVESVEVLADEPPVEESGGGYIVQTRPGPQ